MAEFIKTTEALFTGFPPVLTWIIGSFFGSLVTLLVTTNSADLGQPLRLIGRFFAGWFTGAFIGPFASPAVQAVVKAPTASLAFLSGLGGFLTAKRIIKNKQIEVDSNDPKTPGSGLDV